MKTASKLVFALGIASAMVLGNAGSSFAGSDSVRAKNEAGAVHRHHHRSGYDDHASSPNDRAAPSFGYRPGGLNAPNQHRDGSWDPYGLRWENTEG